MVAQAIVGAESGAIVADRKELKAGISTIGCGFGTAGHYRQLRFVKNCFCWKWRSGDIWRGRRVCGVVTVVHTIGVTGKKWRRKGEQFTPELLWLLLGVGLVVRRDYSSRRTDRP